jgi:hypothetical protein
MTNLIGLALVILGVNVSTNYYTNHVGISCETAGCTNWYWGEVQVEVERGVYGSMTNEYGQVLEHVAIKRPVYETRKEKMCCHMHYTNEVIPIVRITEYTVGVKDTPLFKLRKQENLQERSYGMSIYHDGWFITE